MNLESKKLLFTFKWRLWALPRSWRRADVYGGFARFFVHFTQVLRLIDRLHNRAGDFCFCPGWDANAATVETDERCQKTGRGFQRDGTAVWFRSLARGDLFAGDLFAGEVGNAEDTIPGSNKGVTTLGSEGDAGDPTLSSDDRNQHFCSRQTPDDPS